MSELTKLSEVIFHSGSRAGHNTNLPVYSVTKHAGFVKGSEYFKKNVHSKDLSTYKVVRRGEFAYATIHLDEGSIGIAPEDCLISPMYTVFSIDSQRVVADYLLALLKSPTMLRQYSILGAGSVHRRKSISLSTLSKIQIALPSVPQQRRIAVLLSSSRAGTQRSWAIQQHADRLIQHKVIESHNKSSTKWIPISSVVKAFISGKSFPDAEEGADSLWSVLRVGAVSTGHFVPEQAKLLPQSYSPPTAHQIRAGDLLINRSNTPELVGQVAYVWEPPPYMAMPDTIWKFDWHDASDATPIYMWATLKTPRLRRAIQDVASGSNRSMLKINRQRMMGLAVPWPTYDERLQFEEFARSVNEVRTHASLHHRHSEELYNSLQYRAFRGDL